ncbi:MAG: response regulator [Bacteroidetes bacterium]|nr:response regulator [Bacteroidota bacterium]MBS1756259.1 response regulator [Bacteroidota bacterium]
MAKILIVDDSTELLDLFSLLLSSQGDHVRTATNIKKAQEQLQWIKFDVVLLDVRLGNEDGRQLSYIISMEYNIPVILISGDAELLRNYTTFGAMAVLEKPFDLDVVHKTIEDVLNRKK